MDPRFGGNFGGMNLAGQFRYGPSFGVYEGGLGELTPGQFLPQFLGKSGREMPPPPASFDPNDLYYQPQNPFFMPGSPQFLGPFKYEQQRDRFILNDPRSGVAGNPSFDITPKSGPGTPGYSIYNDPKLPGARRMRREIERVLGLPPIKFPEA